MKFETIFEQHKIPEWYTEYLNQAQLAKELETERPKLQGFFILDQNLNLNEIVLENTNE